MVRSRVIAQKLFRKKGACTIFPFLQLTKNCPVRAHLVGGNGLFCKKTPLMWIYIKLFNLVKKKVNKWSVIKMRIFKGESLPYLDKMNARQGSFFAAFLTKVVFLASIPTKFQWIPRPLSQRVSFLKGFKGRMTLSTTRLIFKSSEKLYHKKRRWCKNFPGVIYRFA